ncbi:laccase-15-like [Phoenix dactylifera]|uniref:Laccase n=1 Tax=Phoenix dactylifera TaxID=42345 RepID=A0A8B9A0Q7_PHODC|nr:laccase-15-like [Phoenix dactylifera]
MPSYSQAASENSWRKPEIRHGVKQPRNPWSDGPAYITQCPIQPGKMFKYTILLSSEEGTVWWHAHDDWNRATVHGAIVVYPKPPNCYPFKYHQEFLLILGEWWKRDMKEILEEAIQAQNDPVSDAFTINGQPGDLYPCSKSGTFRMVVEQGKRYLLRVINAAMSNSLFFSISKHQLMVVGSDGSYVKPITTDYILIAPGETMDLLLEANQNPTNLYYMAARALVYQNIANFDINATTAILTYTSNCHKKPPSFPSLPFYNDTAAATNFTSKLRSLADGHHPINVPTTVSHRLFITVSLNSIRNETKTTLSASLNNISFEIPSIDILQAYYKRINGVFGNKFPCKPPLYFNFTADDPPTSLLAPRKGTDVKVFEYGACVEVVFQGTSLVLAEDHPMHLHGFSFYVVGWGIGNFDARKDPLTYNLVDPPLKNTIDVPRDGWAAIRFKANNPDVWYLHCHLERHLTWGMTTVFIVKDGAHPQAKMLPPPRYMPPC